MSQPESRVLYDHALEIAVEARTLARSAHDRADAVDGALADIRKSIAGLQVAVGKLNTKVAIAATAGSAVGGGLVAVAVAYFSG